ncbi:MAG: adenosylcobinamide-GDP ribazoletransferase [Sulfolobales archaeon]|nr:adenosylcobinamide-GDP ribazoletransferase [Sulfolobales archaeon]MCX8208332.1 adenosylcobinamide-GDP ribazoletransferase [Sulfolobales archaeon]MDW8010665.1 adenosylcobinamide-GDP ribazoletransferase [Sulfolobales archaeon]
MPLLRSLRSLISLLTRIPVGSQDVEEAAQYFYLVPLIGLVEGLAISLAIVVLRAICENSLMASSLYLVAHLAVVGGMHLDGFADYFDVVGSQKRGASAIPILKDPRRGTFSILAVVVNFLVSAVSVSVLLESLESSTDLALYLVCAYLASSESMFLTCFLGREEPYEGLAKSFSRYSKKSESLVKNLAIYALTLLALQVLWHSHILAIFALLPVATSLITSRDANERIGFVNGDVLGFSYETSRVSALVLAALVA